MTSIDAGTTSRDPRSTGVILAAMLALALISSSAASAEPLFKPTGGTFTGVGHGTGSGTIAVGGHTIVCTASTTSGTISSATLAGGVTVSFTGCETEVTSGRVCTVKSAGAGEGTIVTNTLHGVLGLILPSGSGSGVGLLLLPATTKRLVNLEGNECFNGTFTGNFAGELSPTQSSQTTGKFVFAAGSGPGESIKDFVLSTGGLVRPELEFLGLIASIEAAESLTFSAALEVT